MYDVRANKILILMELIYCYSMLNVDIITVYILNINSAYVVTFSTYKVPILKIVFNLFS